MARTIKIKKKTNKNRRTHISNISGKYLLKDFNNSRISKKYKSRVNNKKTNRVIKNIKIKTQSNISNGHTNTQLGGFFGLDYLTLKWKLNKFNNIISRLNAFDKSIQKDIDTYKIQAKDFETSAKEKADLQTQFIDNYRQKVMFEIYREDTKEAPKTKESIAIKIDDSIKTIDNHLLSIGKRINELDRGIGKDIPEYDRLMRIFKSKVNKFNEITLKYAKFSDFHEHIKKLKRRYDDVAGKDKKTISKAYRKEAKQFERYKDEYTRILNLTESEIQNRRNIKKEIDDLLQTAEHYKDQFGTYKGKIKKAPGVLDRSFKEIECSGGSGTLCKWVEKYKLFAKELLLVDTMCSNIIKGMSAIQQSAEICVKNLSTVFEIYKKDPQPEAMLRFETDIRDLISLFKDAEKAISLLKAEFYKQTPASRIMIDYNQLTIIFNYARSKLKIYIEMFNPEVTFPKDLQKGGYIMYGGSGHTTARHSARPSGHGGHSVSFAPTSNCSKIIKFDGELNNTKFYDKQIQHFKMYQDVYKELSDSSKIKNDCFDKLENFKIIFKNYYQVWLFWQNVNTNFNDNTIPILPNIEESLKHLIVIENILKDTTTNPVDTTKWLWDDKLKRFIADTFKKISHFTIPKDILGLSDKNLKDIFELSTDAKIIDTVRNKSYYAHVKDLVETVDVNDTKSFGVGVLAWDSDAVNASHFNNKLLAIESAINDNEYPDKTRAAATPGAPATTTLTTVTTVHVPVYNIDHKLKEIKDLKDELDTNISFSFQDEYYNFLDEINNGFKKQEKRGIRAANQINIEKVLSELKTKINAFSSLSPYDIDYFRREIDLYNGLYLQPLITVFDTVKSRGYDDAVARKAADSVRELIEKGSRGDVAIEEVLKLNEYTEKKLPITTNTTPAAKPVVTQVVTTNNKNNNKNTKKDLSVSAQLKQTDVNLIQQVLKRLSIMGDFELQMKNIGAEYVKIYKVLKEVAYGDGSIKNISDKLQTMTQALLELKYIEPKIVGVSAKADTSIRLPLADWIVQAADKNFKELQKLSITKDLEAHMKKNRIFKIYEEQTHADDAKLTDLLIAILPFAGDKNQIRQKIYANTDYIATLGNVNNLRRLIEILKSKLDKGSEDSKKKACSILTELATVVGLLDEEPRKIMNDAMYYYDPDAKDKSRPSCYFKDERKDGGKGGKGGQGGKGDSRGDRGYRGDRS